MFDIYIICEDGFQNVSDGEEIIGFQLKARLPYHRGLGLSMVEQLNLIVDSEIIPRTDIRVTLHGNTYTMDEMETEYKDRWEFGEKGIITVLKPGGLIPGIHRIELEPHMRISYIPDSLKGKDAKELALVV
jgi:hypothetical protein